MSYVSTGSIESVSGCVGNLTGSAADEAARQLTANFLDASSPQAPYSAKLTYEFI